MIKSQAQNLVNFSILMHNCVEDGITGYDPSYIMEKWEKYIGIKTLNNDNYVGYVEPTFITNWLKKWRVSDNLAIKMRDILKLIHVINTKHFHPRGFDADVNDPSNHIKPNMVWLLSDLIEKFEDIIGNVNTINKDLYNNLHFKVNELVKNWEEHPKVVRDYNLTLLLNNRDSLIDSIIG